MQGEPVHRWTKETRTHGTVELLPSGHLLALGEQGANERFHGPGVGGGTLVELDWDSHVVWSTVVSDDQHLAHHDFEVLPNGNVIVIAMEYIPQSDAISLGRSRQHVGPDGLWVDSLLELKPTRPEGAEVVWEWHAYDHLVQDFDPAAAYHGTVAEEAGRLDINFDHRDRAPLTEDEITAKEQLEEEMLALGYGGGGDEEDEEEDEPSAGHHPDWLHTNAVEYLPRHDLLVLSSPHLNELLVLDHSTTSEEAATDAGGRFGHGGEILYRWGNPRNYGAGTEAEQMLFYQHNPSWQVSEGSAELRLLVFNNGSGRPGKEYSSVDEIVLPFDPEHGFTREPHRPFGPFVLAWTYSSPEHFFSPFISGTQRLPGGNTLICNGVDGRVFEVTPKGKVVWDYRNPYDREPDAPAGGAPPRSLFRATRLARDRPGLAGRGL
jgi:hypothetical protein